MTNEDKQLLLKDLCARLPYGVRVKVRSNNDIRTVRAIDIVEGIVHFVESDSISSFGVHIEHPTTFRQVGKPYLRPMSSMTGEEKQSYYKLMDNLHFADGSFYSPDIKDWLDERFFDYRGLIPMGLALEAPENMYKID